MPRSSATITRIPGLRVGQANDNISASLKWRRGLWRLWVLASSAWLLGWGVYLTIWAIRSGLQTGDLLAIPVLLLGPPLALLVFGLATSWAFKGFLPDKAAPDEP